MSAWRKALFGVCCFVPLAFYGVGIAALAAGGIENDPLRNALLAFAYVGMAIYIAVMVAAIVHVARRDDFDGGRRTKWLLLIFFLNAFVLPFFWWRLIRPLPTPEARETGAMQNTLRDERGDLSVGTNTALTACLTIIAIPIIGLAQGDWKLAAMGLIGGLFLLGIAYLLLRLEEPPKPPSA